MSNTSLTEIEFGQTKSQIFKTMKLVIAYSPFLIIALGITGNPASLFFIVSSKLLRKMSSMVIIAFISIIDILSLFTWNLNIFYVYKFGIKYVHTNIYLCKIMIFIQYFSLQSSGFLLSLLTIDRYVTITSTPGSFYSKLPFRTTKSAIIWSSLILSIIFILNSHILILNGYIEPPNYFNKIIEIKSNESVYFIDENTILISNNFICGTYTTGFRLNLVWPEVNLYLKSIIPAILMLFFNSLLIYKITRNPNSKFTINNRQIRKIQKKKRNLSLSLSVISFSFLILTLPAEFFYAYLNLNFKLDITQLIGNLLNFLSFLNYTSLFYNLILFNVAFRKHVQFQIGKAFRFLNVYLNRHN